MLYLVHLYLCNTHHHVIVTAVSLLVIWWSLSMDRRHSNGLCILISLTQFTQFANKDLHLKFVE